MTHSLSDLEHDILAIEAQWWRYPGAKETAIADQLGLTATRYYQLLNHLIDQPAALAHAPLLIRRLQRLRDTRRRHRTRGTLGPARLD